MMIENPMIPITTPLMHGMCEGAKVEVDGMPYSGHQQGFTVEFLTPTGSLLHMDVRFHQHTVVLNHFHDGHWHCEERFPIPFCIGAHFHLKIKNHPGHFAIHVNGMHVAHFHHRGNPHHITAFHIRGDIAVHKICFHNFSHPVTVCAPPPPAPVIISQPVYTAPPVYIPPPPAPVVMAAPPVVVVEDHHHHGAGAAVAGAAVGAVVGGAILGSAIRHHHRRHW